MISGWDDPYDDDNTESSPKAFDSSSKQEQTPQKGAEVDASNSNENNENEEVEQEKEKKAGADVFTNSYSENDLEGAKIIGFASYLQEGAILLGGMTVIMLHGSEAELATPVNPSASLLEVASAGKKKITPIVVAWPCTNPSASQSQPAITKAIPVAGVQNQSSTITTTATEAHKKFVWRSVLTPEQSEKLVRETSLFINDKDGGEVMLDSLDALTLVPRERVVFSISAGQFAPGPSSSSSGSGSGKPVLPVPTVPVVPSFAEPRKFGFGLNKSVQNQNVPPTVSASTNKKKWLVDTAERFYLLRLDVEFRKHAKHGTVGKKVSLLIDLQTTGNPEFMSPVIKAAAAQPGSLEEFSKKSCLLALHSLAGIGKILILPAEPSNLDLANLTTPGAFVIHFGDGEKSVLEMFATAASDSVPQVKPSNPNPNVGDTGTPIVGSSPVPVFMKPEVLDKASAPDPDVARAGGQAVNDNNNLVVASHGLRGIGSGRGAENVLKLLDKAVTKVAKFYLDDAALIKTFGRTKVWPARVSGDAIDQDTLPQSQLTGLVS